jgi:hypothetical protein
MIGLLINLKHVIMTYKVQKGDSWHSIAKTTGIDINELLRMNNATLTTSLHPGQELKTNKTSSKSDSNKVLITRKFSSLPPAEFAAEVARMVRAIAAKRTGSAFYISYPEHKITTKGTPLEGITGTVPLIQGHAASIILDPNGNATYHTYGRYGDMGSYKTKQLPARRSGESEKDYLKRIRPHLEYADAGEPVRATYIPGVNASKARAYYEKQPEKGNYGFVVGSTCVGEACNGIDAGRKANFRSFLHAIAPNLPESPHQINYGQYETYNF